MPLPDPPRDVFTSLTGTMDRAREAIASVGLRMYRVYFLVERWAGQAGEGEPVARTFTEIAPAPKVRFLSAARIAASGGVYREGAVELTKITRSLRREQLLGQTEQGDRRARNERFSFALVPRGQIHAELYNPVGEPVLRPLEWTLVLNPITRRLPAPDID